MSRRNTRLAVLKHKTVLRLCICLFCGGQKNFRVGLSVFNVRAVYRREKVIGNTVLLKNGVGAAFDA